MHRRLCRRCPPSSGASRALPNQDHVPEAATRSGPSIEVIASRIARESTIGSDRDVSAHAALRLGSSFSSRNRQTRVLSPSRMRVRSTNAQCEMKLAKPKPAMRRLSTWRGTTALSRARSRAHEAARAPRAASVAHLDACTAGRGTSSSTKAMEGVQCRRSARRREGLLPHRACLHSEQSPPSARRGRRCRGDLARHPTLQEHGRSRAEQGDRSQRNRLRSSLPSCRYHLPAANARRVGVTCSTTGAVIAKT